MLQGGLTCVAPEKAAAAAAVFRITVFDTKQPCMSPIVQGDLQPRRALGFVEHCVDIFCRRAWVYHGSLFFWGEHTGNHLSGNWFARVGYCIRAQRAKEVAAFLLCPCNHLFISATLPFTETTRFSGLFCSKLKLTSPHASGGHS